MTVFRSVQVLRAVLDDETVRRGTPLWRLIAERLCTHDQALQAWPELEKHGDVALKVVDACRQAFEQTDAESRRLPESEENERLDRVEQATRALMDAIEAAPLPVNTSTWHPTLVKQGWQDAVLSVGWRDVHGSVHIGYPLSVHEVLGWSLEMLAHHRAKLPPRATLRQRSEDARARTFVRQLNWHLRRQIGAVGRGTLGKLASAIYALDMPLTAEQVKEILKGTPGPWAGE